ncbi:hypothetical protein [Rosistilla oblonga]|uniref:hypothetical protein n=1 Tax=Rosistilla oblonga TaxID=2527990 RepID=UPI003A96FCBA
MKNQQGDGNEGKQDNDGTIHLEGEEAQLFTWLIGEATEKERLITCRGLYQDGFEFSVRDTETGSMIFGCCPLTRAFVLSKKKPGEFDTQPEMVLSAIQECIESQGGVVQEDDADADSEANDQDMWDFSVRNDFGNDGCVVGLFFSSESREAATQEILSRWGACGVRTEITAAELKESQDSRNFCRDNFNEEEFRSRFEAMSHDERLRKIEGLWIRGIDFDMLDSSSQTHYSSLGANSTFCVDYSLGFKPMSLQPEWRSTGPDSMSIKESLRIEEDTEARMQMIVQIEQAIQNVVRERGGEVEGIGRMIEENECSELFCAPSGCTMIVCRFPNKQLLDQVVKLVLESWGMFDVTVDPESRQLTMEDKIEEAALMAARMEDDSEREQQLLKKRGPAFDELKDQVINEEIAKWETIREGAVDKETRQRTLEEKIEEAARLAARDEMDPERENQLWLLKGPEFDELKDRIIDAEIARWEAERKRNEN